jgi:hypothetical protein
VHHRALSITFTVHTETRQGTATAARSIHTSSQHHTSSQFTHSQFTQSQEVKQRTRGAYLADAAEEQQGMAGARRWRPGGGEVLTCWSSGGPGPDGGGEALDRRRPWSRRQMRGLGPAAEERRWSRELCSCRNKSETLGSKRAKLFYPRACFPPSAPSSFIPARASCRARHYLEISRACTMANENLPLLRRLPRLHTASVSSPPPRCADPLFLRLRG